MNESTVSWKKSIRNHTTTGCSCVTMKLTPYSTLDGRTAIVCGNCGVQVGIIPKDETKFLHRMSTILIEYAERTYYLSNLLAKNPTWRMIMTTDQPESIHEIDSDKVLRLFPGHLIFESKEAREAGGTCNHRLILQPDGRSARCVLCDGLRTLEQEEVQAIEAAQQAGVIFLQWEDRLKAMERLRTGRSKRKRRKRGKKTGPTVSKGVEAQAEVPEGMIPVKEAAEKLQIDAKALRKLIRKGVYEGAKVGGRVHVRLKGS